jgi:DNA-binding phage protein
MTRRSAPARSEFRAGDHLRGEGEIAAYLEAMLADGDARVAA